MNNDKHQDRNPSFSSTLLDEIYRSIDECEAGQVSGGRRQSHGGGGRGSIFIHQQHCSPINLRRAHSIGRMAATVVRDEQRYSYGAIDPLLSSPGGGFSSNCGSHTAWRRGWETEKYTSSLADAQTLPRLRPVRTNVVSKAHPAVGTKAAAASTGEKKITNSKRSQKKQDQECNSDNDRGDGQFIPKPRSRALKIYDHLVHEKAKLQPPLSPGGRLSAFLASLFAARRGKKTKRSSSCSSSSDSSLAAGDATSSNCSSASSYTRSCLSKTSPSSRQLQLNGKKSVTFYPSDSVATTGGTMKVRECSPTSEGEEHGPINIPGESLKNCFHQHPKKGQFMGFKFIDSVNDDDDAESCASSDLFELDHLEPLGDGRRYEGLRPAYETTRVDRPI